MRTASFSYISENQLRCTPSNYAGVCLQNTSDYSPFGVSLEGRTMESEFYRYGFNCKEKIDEVSGDGNEYDFGARIYNPRIGRWLSTDALEKKYAYVSPYVGLGNNPIIYFDGDGNDIVYFDDKGNEIASKRVTSKDVFETHVQTGMKDGNAVFTQAKMPNRITVYSEYEKAVKRDYNKYDYDISAQTFLFNQKKNNGTLPDKGAGGDPSDVPDLDPNTVKTIILKESLYGYASGKNASVDVMQTNVKGDWNNKKKEIGLKEGSTESAKQSISAGIVWLYWKGITITSTKSGYEANWVGGDDWKAAAKKYNGGGDPNYMAVYNQIMEALKNGASKDGYKEQKEKETKKPKKK